MKITWPSGVVIRECPDGSVRYRLPRTGNAGRTTLALLALAAAGVQFAIFLLIFVHGAATDDTIRWTVLFNPMAWLGLVLAAYAVSVLAAGDDILLTRTGLRIITRVGWFRRTARRSLDEVRGLVVSADPAHRWNELLAVCFDSDPLSLARHQPYALLGPLARDLARRMAIADAGREEQVTVAEESLDPRSEHPQQPARSGVLVTEHEGGVAFIIPPRGFHTAVLLALAYGGIFLALSLARLFPVLFGGAATGPGWAPRLWVKEAVFSGFYWLSGVTHILSTVSAASRRVTLAVRGGTLEVHESTFFGESTRQWSRDELSAITTNGVSLRIQPVRGRALVLSGLSWLRRPARQVELRWLAAALRRALRLDKMKEGGNPAEIAGGRQAGVEP